MEWESQTKEDFNQVISSVPASMRPMAQQVISQMSESMARDRGVAAVQREDMVRAFVQYTPAVFRNDMLASLRGLGIDPATY